MTVDDNDMAPETLRRLTVLEPDPARSDRVRARCRAAIGAQGERALPSGGVTALVLEPGLTYALSAGYLAAMVYDVLRVYMRR